jgi:hypothetical protein
MATNTFIVIEEVTTAIDDRFVLVNFYSHYMVRRMPVKYVNTCGVNKLMSEFLLFTGIS